MEEKSQDYSLQIASTGHFSQHASEKDYTKIASSGDFTQHASEGDYSRHASAGDFSQLASSGDCSNLASSGDCSKLASSGDYSNLIMNGDDSVGACVGFRGRIKGKKGCWITLAEWEFDGSKERFVPVCVKSAQIDGEILKEDTWYTLENGKFVECEWGYRGEG